jgi:NAD(P)-dependent dehydrogenase (short-subunit alcohol dehydrogenase family)
MATEFDMHGNNVLVTGALGLIGREISDALASAGANQFLCNFQPVDQIEQFPSELSNKYGRDFHSAQADVSRQNPVIELIANAVEQMGSIDTFVHCPESIPASTVLTKTLPQPRFTNSCSTHGSARSTST